LLLTATIWGWWPDRIILLIGIVKKNAIMMIDFALEAERVEHKPPEEAIFQACLLRFRPIMRPPWRPCWVAATRTGIGNRVGIAPPAGITIVGGLLVSQLLTLYTTPVVYLWFDRLAQRFSHLNLGNRLRNRARRRGTRRLRTK